MQVATPPRSGLYQRQPNNRPRFSGDQLRQMLHLYDRTPFLDLLAEWLECSPTQEDLQAFANKYPDRYASALKALGQLGGYTEKKEVSVNVDVYMQVKNMSDSQIEDELKRLGSELAIPLIAEATEISLDEELGPSTGKNGENC
jgi:hypothetical protein